ncbi:alpha-galactosidase [Nonomuraea turkmeniaca]|uniref:alpha-galactosidase n=1 Tax=Nonomuraea turkmeniaca TaxID=103838 RepID=UPI003CCC4D6F
MDQAAAAPRADRLARRSPSVHTTRRTPVLAFRAGTALFGHLGIEWDLRSASPADRAALAERVRLYQRHQVLLHTGRIVRFDPPTRRPRARRRRPPTGPRRCSPWSPSPLRNSPARGPSASGARPGRGLPDHAAGPHRGCRGIRRACLPAMVDRRHHAARPGARRARSAVPAALP